jgi:hypothetical protein
MSFAKNLAIGLLLSSALLTAFGGDKRDHAVWAASCQAPKVASGPGGRIVAVGDADMLASAYADNQLGPPVAGAVDTLALFDPSVNAGRHPTLTGRLPVPNAVTGPAWSFDVDAAGARAYVIETNPTPPEGVTTLSQLVAVPGTALTVVDICNRSTPREIERVTTVNSPTSVSLRPDGRTLAVAARFPARLVTHTIDRAGRVSPPQSVPLPEGVMPPPDNPFQEVTQAVWSPDGRWLAVFVRGTRKLQLYAAIGSGNALRLVPAGAPADIDEGTFGGRWSPDSRTLAVINVRALSRSLEELFAILPTLLPQDVPSFIAGSVQMVEAFDAHGRPAPRVVQTLPGPAFPEGVAFSRDGRHVATINQQTTALTPGTPLYSPLSTISLYARDAAAGTLKLIANTPFEGTLPESVDFDPTGAYLAVAVFHPGAADTDTGALDVWRLTGSGLERLSRATAPRGLHVLRWLP